MAGLQCGQDYTSRWEGVKHPRPLSQLSSYPRYAALKGGAGTQSPLTRALTQPEVDHYTRSRRPEGQRWDTKPAYAGCLSVTGFCPEGALCMSAGIHARADGLGMRCLYSLTPAQIVTSAISS